MDAVESQQRLLDSAVNAAFREWRSQLRVQLEESHALRQDLERKSKELQQCVQRFEQLEQENKALRRQLRENIPPATPVDLTARDSDYHLIVQDSCERQATIDQLQCALRYMKRKAKDWKDLSSPLPEVVHQLRTSSPERTIESKGNSTSCKSPHQDHSQSSNQALLHAPISPLDIHRLTPTTTGPLDCSSEPQLPPCPPSCAIQPVPIQEQPPHNAVPHTRPRDDLSSDSIAPPTQGNIKVETHDQYAPVEYAENAPTIVSARTLRPNSGRQSELVRDQIVPLGSRDQPVTIKNENCAGDPLGMDNELISDVIGATSTPATEILGDQDLSALQSAQIAASKPPGKRKSREPDLQIAEDTVFHSETERAAWSPAAHAVVEAGTIDACRSSPLNPIANNTRLLDRTDLPSEPARKKRKPDHRGATAVPIVAEDGEEYSRGRKGGTAHEGSQRVPKTVRDSAHGRLDNLLAAPSPHRTPLARPSSKVLNQMDGHLFEATISANGKNKDELHILRSVKVDAKDWDWYALAEGLLQSLGLPIPPQPGKYMRKHNAASTEANESTAGSPRPRKSTPAATRNGHTPAPRPHAEKRRPFLPPRDSENPGPEDHEPFRCRPLHRLSLEHFTINPAANAGERYAYTEVVRNQEQRKCLPGCTRECCRSQFQAIALTLPTLSADGKLNPNAREANEQSDDRILLAFLGTGSEEKIRTLTNIARENLLLKAKTKLVADRYGKMHRQAYERQQSPPGFWRTEMPGSQEEEQDRTGAKRREREEVECRFREANREDGKGRWMFADE